MNSEVLSIGNEVLSGRTLDTNFQVLARLLEESGAHVVGHQTVPDDPAAIADALRLAWSRADLVVTTGGLGPTPDDLTVDAVAAVLGRAVVTDEGVLSALRARWRTWGRDMPPNNERQARVPERATVWPNPVGSAPGILAEHEGRHVVLLPGVPEEMKAIAAASLAPWVRARSALRVEYALVRTVGIAESVLEARLADAAFDGAWIAYLPGQGGVDVRIALPSGGTDVARAQFAESVRTQVVRRAKDFVYATEDRTLEQVVGDLLLADGLRVAVAESCTGGLLGGRITATPGSSQYFEGGVICYSNAAKVAHAGVAPALIEAHGAVSEEVARALAAGVAARFGTACGIGVTGVAGPDGGTSEKPVGTVHIAAVGPRGAYHRPLKLTGNRAQIRERSVTAALDLMRRLLAGLPATSPDAMGTPPPRTAVSPS